MQITNLSFEPKSLNTNRIRKTVNLRETPNPSLEEPFRAALDKRARICLERAELVTQSYMQTEGKSWILRRALALDHLLRNMTVYILDGEMIVGNYASSPQSLPTYPEFSSRWLEESLKKEFKEALDEKGKQRLKEINKYWKYHNVEDQFQASVPEELKEYTRWTGAMAGPWDMPLGPMILDYKRLFRLGLNGIREEIRRYRAKVSYKDRERREKMDFYEAAEISAEAAIAFAQRYEDLAGSKSKTAHGDLKNRFQTVAKTCSRVPAEPPQTFHEALQAFFFIHLISSEISWCSLGLGQRFDQLFYPYYKKEKEAGTLTYEGAVKLFEYLWIKLEDLGQVTPPFTTMVLVGGTKFQNVTIGGVDENGEDATNELSFAILDATMNIRTIQPSLCLRYHDKIDPRLVDKAIDCIATGIGMPAIFNDEAAMKWHMNMFIDHMNPEALAYFGSRRPWVAKAFLSAIKSKKFGQAKKLSKALYPGIDGAFHNWPYRAAAGRGRMGSVIKSGLKKAGVIDTDLITALVRNWSPIACVTGGISGMCVHGGMTNLSAASALNFTKCIEYVLYQGIEQENGKQLGLRTPDPRTFRRYEDFMDVFLEQIRFVVEKIGGVYELSEMIYRERLPRPFDSLFMTNAIPRGRDATHKTEGAYSEILTIGPVNAADSLAAIKKLVFDEKSVTMDEIVNACATNFEGREDLMDMCLKAPKFGNDNDNVDIILADMYRSANETVRSVKDHFGKPFALEAAVVGGFFAGGSICGATPDGRRRGETLSDGQLSPMRGRDMNGPTAVLKSCSKVDPTRTWNQLLNQKVQAGFLRGRNKKLFADYLRAWHGFGNWHIQFNCINKDILADAQRNPERHSNLIVRVSGYSAYFVDLTPAVQNDIIQRTEQDMGGFKPC